MIEIVTKDGVFLDLSPDDEFEIEYESPLFADDRIPVPYSTSIAFLPTATNCRVFGYVDAMMLEPAVKAVDIEIRVSGIPLFSGSLEYDSYEDGKLNYAFSAKSVEDALGGYIHETEGLTKVSGRRVILGNRLVGEVADYIERSRQADPELDFGTPMIVSAENIAKVETPRAANNEISPDAKFKNWHWSVSTPVAPAVRVSRIVENTASGVKVSFGTEAKSVYDSLAVLALYSRESSWAGFNTEYGVDLTLDVADKLPECTKVDFIINVMKIVCASLWPDGKGYLMLQNSEILESSDAVEWDGKVSDIYSMSREEAQMYDFGYKDEESGNSLDPDSSEIDSYSGGLRGLVLYAGTQDGTYKETDTGDIYSRVIVTAEGSPVYVSMDIVYRNLGKASDESAESDRDSYNASTDFQLVSCVPMKVDESAAEQSEFAILMCPKISFPTLGDDRPDDVYVGILAHNQLVDKGFLPQESAAVSEEDGDRRPGTTDKNIDVGMSIIPGVLRKGLHKKFADWIETDRMMVSVDLNLTVMDIAGLKLWRKVYFRGRTWLIKKLTLTFAVESDLVQVSGDFVSA